MPARGEEFPTAEAFMPATISLPTLREAACGCKGCDLYRIGTQTVFGEGPKEARVMFVGEQPGDQEDLAGKPFVGPSGAMLDSILEKVGIDRGVVYVTNAVKHFKFEPRGKRRIHAKPSARQVAACKPWLKAEVEAVRPDVIVALGATAAQSMLGNAFRVTQQRGQPLRDTTWAPCVIATVHPSSLLRAPDEEARRAAIAAFEADLRAVKREMDQLTGRGRTAPQAARGATKHPGAAAREPAGKSAGDGAAPA
ncbi:MAG TPA: UdgX family uracil-DNA binding protein, partial [Tepidisphaeraceae bacterium]|nr:UdgX family uracil-DNA binding protein [Tepidisphaeraceae bacterium]